MFIEYRIDISEGEEVVTLEHDTSDSTVSVNGDWMTKEETNEFLKAVSEIAYRAGQRGLY